MKIEFPGRDRSGPKPKIKLPLEPRDYVLETLAALFMVALVVITFTSWRELPQTVPTKFDSLGRAKEYSDKALFLVMPITSLLMYALLSVLSFFPHVYNYSVPVTKENAPGLYRIGVFMIRSIKVCLGYLFLALEYVTLKASQGRDPGVPGMLASVAIPMVALAATVIGSVVAMHRLKG
jgi:uncharacterized membrane protein